MDFSPFHEKELPGYCFAGAWWAIRQDILYVYIQGLGQVGLRNIL
jgi:hypothetical protein